MQMSQIILEVVLTGVLGFIGICARSVLNNFENRQGEMKKFLENMQKFVTDTSTDLGKLSKQVEVNTDDIKNINERIKTICENNSQTLETIRAIQGRISQDTAVQAEQIASLEKAIDEIKERVSRLEQK